jgi:nitrile hydratase accessory protein
VSAGSVTELEGTAAAPPRSNGELVFEEPWQMRAFGLAADLVDAGRFTWDEFRVELIEAIGAWEASDAGERPEWVYYEQWLTALERMTAGRELVSADALDSRATEYAERPHGHDH